MYIYIIYIYIYILSFPCFTYHYVLCIKILEKKIGVTFFSVNQLKNNDTSENKERAMYCFLTFNGIFHSKKDLLK